MRSNLIHLGETDYYLATSFIIVFLDLVCSIFTTNTYGIPSVTAQIAKIMLPRFIKSLVQSDPSLILHIGMPKTGSTVLQNFLFYNRERLQQQKVLYPNKDLHIHQHTGLVKSIGAPLFDWAHFNQHIPQFDPATYLNEIIKQCRTQRCRDVILSSEFFWAAPAMQASSAEYHRPSTENFSSIKQFLTACREFFSVFSKVTIVVYLRRQDYWIDSFFNHQVKEGFGIPSTDDLLGEAKNYLLYHKNCEILAEVFGRENLVIRNYENLLHGDITADFLETVGLQANLLEQAPKTQHTVNSKISRTSAGIMKKAAALEFDREALTLFREVLQEVSFRARSEKRKQEHTLFDPEFYKTVLELYHQDNLKLAQEYIDIIGSDIEGLQEGAAEENKRIEDGFEGKCEQLLSLLLSRLSDAQ